MLFRSAHLEAVGYQDLESKKPMRTDTIFQVRSMTKSVTAVAIMILLEEGRLTLSDPVEKHLPEFRDQMMIDSRDGDRALTLKKPSRPITIRDLLTHTSGMGAEPKVGNRAMRTLAEMVSIYARPLEFEPGTKWLYSDPGFATLGRIVEVVADQPYEKFLEDRIFHRLGMNDSFFSPPPEKRGRIASMYRLEDGNLRKVDAELYPQGAKFSGPGFGMHSTASDMAAFYQMMVNGGRSEERRVGKECRL